MRPFQILDLGGDTDLGKLRCQHLTALPRVSRRRKLQADFERRGHAGLGEQLLCLLDIERIDIRRIDVAKRARRVEAADRHAKTVDRTFDHGFAVNRGEDRAANPHIVERLLLVVDGDDGLGPRTSDHDDESRVGLELSEAARGGHARERIDVARQQ